MKFSFFSAARNLWSKYKMKYYLKQFFLLNLKDYPHIGIYFPIGMVLIFLTVAISLISFVITYQKRGVYDFCLALSRHNANSPENAKTLSELHLGHNNSLKRAIRRGGQLAFMVKRVGEVKPTYEEARKKKFKYPTIDFAEARFYVAGKGADRAERIANGPYPAWWKPIALTAFCIIVLAVLFVFLPDLLTMLDEFVA